MLTHCKKYYLKFFYLVLPGNTNSNSGTKIFFGIMCKHDSNPLQISIFFQEFFFKYFVNVDFNDVIGLAREVWSCFFANWGKQKNRSARAERFKKNKINYYCAG
jgi:hypothetical protein